MGTSDEELRERAGGMSILVFLFSVTFILYVLAGYPLILAAWAKAFPRPIRKEFIPQTVSIIVPVRNGARWMEAKIQSLLQSEYPGDLLNILIVSDGSTDGTEELVRRYPDARVRLLALPPGGKAIAVNHGLESVTGELIVLTDVRQAFDPGAIRRMAACFADLSVGVVTGELVIREGATQEQYNTGLYWQYEKWIRRNLNRIDAMLGATGSIYAIRRELAVHIPPEILLDDVYIPFAVALRGQRRIYFEDDAKAYDLPTSLNTEFWRKVRTQAGVYQILFRFPALLSPFNRRFIHFLSHKLGRLLLPFAMLAAAVSGFFLPQPWRTPVLMAQGLFYLLAISDPVIPETFPLKRLSAVIRAFVVLTAAAFCALAVFVLPAQKLWKETR
jgi:cellulose synthase/poly-beta-1,6-N-acetylglucosamine synthase-like glycosyltransferase